ncbi:hypothetical protein 1 [Hubei toti-like virus 15]|uniref:Capsid protein n=1 Tax=Hubei toti-like virus 15 TaxID=1923303 RepID=A0A1L3KFF5_9VIRU|nr:hypothetical protein 1 [Hubei toti-like virus 15]APG76029.1 hypothetical protein 1 [Hubei toti-like virus 15]
MADATTPSVSPLTEPQAENPTTSSREDGFASVRNLQSWIKTPLSIVGSNNAPLSAYPTGFDTASIDGQKKQQYSTFSVLGASYLSYLCLRYSVISSLQQNTQTQTQGEYDIVNPPPGAVAALTIAQQAAYHNKELLYTRAHAFVPTAAIARKMARIIKMGPATLSIPTVQSLQTTTPIDLSEQNIPTETNNAVAASIGTTSSSTTLRSSSSTTSANSGPSDHATGRSINPQPDDPPCEIISKPEVIPYRVVKTSHLAGSSEVTSIPYSEIYNAISASLSSEANTAIRATLKSALVCEASTWSVLVKTLSQESGSVCDVAPLVRLATLSYALSSTAASFDTMPYKLFRNMSVSYQGTAIHAPDPNLPHSIIAMPLEVFTTFMVGTAMTSPLPSIFLPSEVDKGWVGIPISEQDARLPCIREIITSHISSDLTFGTITKRYNVSAPGDITGQLLCNPASNMSYVHGPRHVILIIKDRGSTNETDSIQIGGLQVPVYRNRTGQAPMITPANWTTEWVRYYNTANSAKILSNIQNAWNHLTSKTITLDTAGRALSVAAELTLATPPGLYLHPNSNGIAYDYDRPLSGAFVIHVRDNNGTCKLDKTDYMADVITLTTPGSDQTVKKVMAGINIASISPLHLPPSGLVPTTYTSSGPSVYAANDPDLTKASDTYHIPCSSTLKRLSVYLGLINRTSTPYYFASAEALSGWVHMLAHANSANTAAMLQEIDMPARDWTGFNTDWSENNRFEEINSLKRTVSMDMIKHFEAESEFESWDSYDPDWISTAYGGIDPFSNTMWWQQSPVPSHFLLQWYKKLKTVSCPETRPGQNPLLYVNGRKKFAVTMTISNKPSWEWIIASIDTHHRHPIVVDTSYRQNRANAVLGSWIEQTQYQSLSASNARGANQSFFETMAHTESLKVTFSGYVGNRQLSVVDSNYGSGNWTASKPRVSELQWPDPPSAVEQLSVSKNLRSKPAEPTAGKSVLADSPPTPTAAPPEKKPSPEAPTKPQAVDTPVKNKASTPPPPKTATTNPAPPPAPDVAESASD